MAKFRLRKGITIGQLAAENDRLLQKAFVDTGYISSLLDVESPHFLVLGRTGAGKTALLKRLETIAKGQVAHLHPEELSMQYLQASTILRNLLEMGINLEPFYKFLWRHVIILQLIRMRYENANDVPSIISSLFQINEIRNKKKTKTLAQEYLQKHGEEYWIKTDTRIKNITSEFETKVTEDEKLAAALNNSLHLGARRHTQSNDRKSQKIDQELVNRAHSIVSDQLIAALNRVIDQLSAYGFTNQQRDFYIIIDDLDKDWVSDDDLYLDLVKSLLVAASDINRRLERAKIIVAVRDDIFRRLYRRPAKHEPQREKWRDVRIQISWSRRELVDILRTRCDEIFKAEYTNTPPALADIFPDSRRRGDPVDYILDRTLLRPRDLIDFVNTALEQQGEASRISWPSILKAEVSYSGRRLEALADEWKHVYRGIDMVLLSITKGRTQINASEIDRSTIERILSQEVVTESPWLSEVSTMFTERGIDKTKKELLEAAFLVGAIGVLRPDLHEYVYVNGDLPFESLVSEIETANIQVHKMLWSALGLQKYHPSNEHDGEEYINQE